MKITLIGVPADWEQVAHTAIKLVDALVWGNEMSQKVDHLIVVKSSNGVESDPEIFKGLLDCYDATTRTCTLHVKGIIDQGADSPSNLMWAITHDLAHAFDVAHGNLVFNIESQTITYLGKQYEYKIKATHVPPFPEGYVPQFRDSRYYESHNLLEPWEVRPLFAADCCMAEYRRGEFCPNLIKESA